MHFVALGDSPSFSHARCRSFDDPMLWFLSSVSQHLVWKGGLTFLYLGSGSICRAVHTCTGDGCALRSRNGSNPHWPSILLEKVIRPAAESRYRKEDRIAYLPLYLRHFTRCQRRKCESGSRTHAARQHKVNAGGIPRQLVAKRAAQHRLVEGILPERVADSLPFVVAQAASTA
jgi:hypothetical protein